MTSPTRPAGPWWPSTRAPARSWPWPRTPTTTPRCGWAACRTTKYAELNADAGPLPALQPGHQRPVSGRLHLQALRGRRGSRRRPHHRGHDLRLQRQVLKRASRPGSDWNTDGHGERQPAAGHRASPATSTSTTWATCSTSSPARCCRTGVRKFGFGAADRHRPAGGDHGQPGARQGLEGGDGKTDDGQDLEAGDEINLAIGQGDLLVTPLQMAVALSAIANGGTVLGAAPGPADHRRLRQRHPPVREREAGRAGHRARTILDADPQGHETGHLRPRGTAYDAFKGFPITVAGKTGTAEKKPEDDYALFMGYAPADGNTSRRSWWSPSSSRAGTVARSPPRWCAGSWRPTSTPSPAAPTIVPATE